MAVKTDACIERMETATVTFSALKTMVILMFSAEVRGFKVIHLCNRFRCIYGILKDSYDKVYL